MINMILSIAIGALLWVGVALFVSDSLWAGLLPFLIAVPAAFYFLNKRVARKFEAIVNDSQKALMSISTVKNEQQRDIILDKSIQILKQGYKYRHYQFFTKAQLDGQIGQIYYVRKKFKEAAVYLENAMAQNWIAVCMRACLKYRSKDIEGMKKDFVKAIRYNKKIPLIRNLYAWCLLKSSLKDEAIAVLSDAAAEMPKDTLTAENLDLIRNNGKMRMRGWNEEWYQFHLDEPPVRRIVHDRRSAFKRPKMR